MKTILIVILVVLIVAAGAFYWYEYRPSQIREKCNKLSPYLISEKIYQSCLLNHGLEK